MLITVCVPNFNYERYLGKTIASVLTNNFPELEIVISDNASTDCSVRIIETLQQTYGNIRIQTNKTNLGFSSNLNKAAEMAVGKYMVMLSSDDIMMEGAMLAYRKILETYPLTAVTSSMEIIDGEGIKMGRVGPDERLWTSSDIDVLLSSQLRCTVYRVDSSVLLERCLKTMANPFNFCATMFSKDHYEKVGGYANRLINPDKWFHWKLVAEAPHAIYIDKELFQYRVHDKNQSALQAKTGHLKYLMDEYRNIVEMDAALLTKAGMTAYEFVDSFITNDIYKHGIGEFSRGRWVKAVRIFFFGLSTFPGRMISRVYFIGFVLILLLTPLGAYVCSVVLNREKK
ncbi:MAG: glycosyltransferase family 2 protein [Cytophagales bacterium]|nr:glycosyltransferase family 2 protein [Cytophagales bacterium]